MLNLCPEGDGTCDSEVDPRRVKSSRHMFESCASFWEEKNSILGRRQVVDIGRLCPETRKCLNWCGL